MTRFSIKKKQKKNMVLKHWTLPKDHFNTHLFFSIFGWGDPSQLGSWSEGCVKPLKLSREAILEDQVKMECQMFILKLLFEIWALVLHFIVLLFFAQESLFSLVECVHTAAW